MCQVASEINSFLAFALLTLVSPRSLQSISSWNFCVLDGVDVDAADVGDEALGDDNDLDDDMANEVSNVELPGAVPVGTSGGEPGGVVESRSYG